MAYFFFAVVVFRSVEWARLVLLLTGGWFIFCGILNIFPKRHFRRAYPGAGLAGKKYHAEMDQAGFTVTGDSCSWRVLWSDDPLKGEDNSVFMFSAKGTIFIFGKQYLTDEQQNQIREFGALRE